MKSGVCPWVSPYLKEYEALRPYNISTGNEYRGINVILLWMNNFRSPAWGSFNQFKNAGYTIKKGSVSTKIIFYQSKEEAGQDRELENVQESELSNKVIKHFPIFNSEQTNNPIFPESDSELKKRKAKKIEQISESFTKIDKDEDAAFYDPDTDSITIQPKAFFPSIDEYYSTLFHEIVHWTGGKKRLDRKTYFKDKKKSYDYEELVAEIGSAFISADIGIPMYKQNAGYIQSYLELFEEDEKCIMRAAAQAEKAVEFIYRMLV